MNPIYFGHNLLEGENFLRTLQKHSGSFVLLTDEKVAALYAEPFLSFMNENELSCECITFSGGEKNKTRKTKEEIEDKLLAQQAGKDTFLIVMGGGVVTDIGGFVAATYCRGIPYLSVPTTLLGMVDASIGGKTGVNVKEGKNLIGTFYPPEAIFIDFSMLSTLSDQEMLNGSAEVIKHCLIADRSSFYLLFENLDKWKQRDLEFLKKFIIKSCRIKKKIVKADLKESGARRILNFGHTIGHAIEVIEEYSLSHGEAIAVGMIVESFISLKMNHIEEKDFDEIYELLKVIGFPLKLSEKVTISGMKEAMVRDKKSKGKIPRFIILNKVGKVFPFKGEYCAHIDESLLEESLGWMIAEFVR